MVINRAIFYLSEKTHSVHGYTQTTSQVEDARVVEVEPASTSDGSGIVRLRWLDTSRRLDTSGRSASSSLFRLINSRPPVMWLGVTWNATDPLVTARSAK